MEKLIKFAVVLMVVSNTAFAKLSFSSQSVTATNSASETVPAKLLAKGVEKEFEVYMLENAKRFTKKTEWSDFLEIVTLYNEKPADFLKLDAVKQANFKVAVLKVNEKLDKIGGEDAKRWKETVNFTTQTMNFLWSFDVNKLSVPSVEEETIEVSTMAPSL